MEEPRDSAAEAHRQLLSEQIEAEEAAAAEAAEEQMEEEGEEDASWTAAAAGAGGAAPEPDAELTGPITVRLVDELRVRLLLNVPLPLTGAWPGMQRPGELAIADHKLWRGGALPAAPREARPRRRARHVHRAARPRRRAVHLRPLRRHHATATTDAVDFRGGRFAPEGEECGLVVACHVCGSQSSM